MDLSDAASTGLDLEPDVPVPIPVGSLVPTVAGTTRVRILGPVDGVPVLLLHGLTASAAINWMHVFGPLAEQHRVIAPDLRGHADGPRMGRRDGIEDLSADIGHVLDHIGVGPVVVVGYSMGGAVAQQLARDRPDLVRSLVLVATAPRFLMAPISRRLYGANAIGARLADPLRPGFRARLLQRFVPHPDPALRELVHRETRKHRARDLVRAAGALGRFKGARFLGTITTPATVVVSSADRTLDPRMQRRFAELLPDPEVIEIPMGHSDLVWQHEAVVPLLVEVIAAAAAST